MSLVRRGKSLLLFASVFLAVPLVVHAGICDVAWDGDKVAAAIAGRPAYLRVPLRDKQQQVTEVTVDQIQAFNEAKDRISRAAGLSPNFIICSGNDPNAFATSGTNGEVVGVTVGMLKLVNGDRDMAGAVIGHEMAHHTQRHRSLADSRDALIGLAALVLGVAVDSRLQRRGSVSTGLGLDLAQLGGALISRKFNRDQEREADDVGFQYMVTAAFNPNGAVRLAERMNQSGSGGIGLFFDSHPGWSERTERFQTMIAGNPQAQQLIARSAPSPTVASTSTQQDSTSTQTIALAPTYTTSDAQKSYSDGLSAWRAKDVVTAVREFRSAAAGGYAPAQAIVGYLYQNGFGGLPKDESEAVRLYRLAADQGDALGQNNLAAAYARGMGGLQKDEAEAVRYFKLSADQGNAQGQAGLGLAYLRGAGGLQKDEAEGVRLFRLSADQGNAQGRNSLGAAYAMGIGGLQKDEVEATRLYRLAADQGHAQAQANLGVMYAAGRGGLVKNEAEAARLFRLSANQGNALGQATLGYMYSTGTGGLSKNEVEALRLYRQSADQGSALGQNNLGAMYEFGRGGLPKDIEEAVLWYQKAAAQGNNLAIANLKRLGRM